MQYYRDCFTSVLHNAFSVLPSLSMSIYFIFHFLSFKINSRKERVDVEKKK